MICVLLTFATPEEFQFELNKLINVLAAKGQLIHSMMPAEYFLDGTKDVLSAIYVFYKQ